MWFFRAAFSICLLSSPCWAWEVRTDEDPMDDTNTAFMSEVDQSANMFSGMGITVKCWENKPESTLVAISSTERWDPAATYAEKVPFRLRVDKADPIDLMGRPINAGGNISFVAYAAEEPKVLDFMSALRDAKKQVGLQIGDSVLRFGARGSTSGVKRLVQTCGLTLP